MSLGSDIFGYIAGAAGLIGILYAMIQSQRPRNKIKHLNELLNDTEDIFLEAERSGLLNPHFVLDTKCQLTSYKVLRDELRTRALCANTIFAECLEIARGLSKGITVTCLEVDECRATILTVSQQERDRLRRELLAQHVHCHSHPPTFGSISRNTAPSHSCPLATPVEPDGPPSSQSTSPFLAFRIAFVNCTTSVVKTTRASFFRIHSSGTGDSQELSEIPSGNDSAPNPVDVSIRHSEQMA